MERLKQAKEDTHLPNYKACDSDIFFFLVKSNYTFKNCQMLRIAWKYFSSFATPNSLRKEAQQLRIETDTRTKWHNFDNNMRLSERALEVERWRAELERYLREVEAEAAVARDAKEACERALEAKVNEQKIILTDFFYILFHQLSLFKLSRILCVRYFVAEVMHRCSSSSNRNINNQELACTPQHFNIDISIFFPSSPQVIPAEVVTECLSIREGRREHEVVRDPVEHSLRRESDLIEQIRGKLKDR